MVKIGNEMEMLMQNHLCSADLLTLRMRVVVLLSQILFTSFLKFLNFNVYFTN